MKKVTAILLGLCMILTLTACGSANGDNNAGQGGPISEKITITLGDTGAEVTIPAELGFEAIEKMGNEFSGGGPSGEWAITANTKLKSEYVGYTLEKFAELVAQTFNGEMAQDANGNYYLTYSTVDSNGNPCKVYCCVREGAEKYYLVEFHCISDYWDQYVDMFTEWATTVEVK